MSYLAQHKQICRRKHAEHCSGRKAGYHHVSAAGGTENSLDVVESPVFDNEKFEYRSPAGLRVLLSAQKVMNGQGSTKQLHVNDVINEVFEVTGFSDILTIE